MRIHLLLVPLFALAGPMHAAAQSAKPPTPTLPRANNGGYNAGHNIAHTVAHPASTASAATQAESADPPLPDGVACAGPACKSKPAVPELKPVARDKTPKLSAAANRSVAESQSFANTAAVAPTLGKGGRVLFTYGDSIPTVVCAPLRVCDVELEPGETIQGAPHIGDSVRWRVSPAISFDRDQRVTHLVIKATAADLDTNLIVPTDRRTYYLRLVSSEDKYVSRVAFEYPDNDERAWRRLARQARPAGSAAAASAAATALDDLPPVALSRLHFDYTVTASGHPRFKPVRVMDDGARIFITMSDDMPVDEAPVLFVVGADGTEQLVNYRLRGNIFVIDRLADKLALVAGTGGEQQRVDIVHGTCRKQGWQGWQALFSRCAAATSE